MVSGVEDPEALREIVSVSLSVVGVGWLLGLFAGIPGNLLAITLGLVGFGLSAVPGAAILLVLTATQD